MGIGQFGWENGHLVFRGNEQEGMNQRSPPPPPPEPSPGRLIREDGRTYTPEPSPSPPPEDDPGVEIGGWTYTPARPFLRPPSSNGTVSDVGLLRAIEEVKDAFHVFVCWVLGLVFRRKDMDLPPSRFITRVELADRLDQDPEVVRRLLARGWTDDDEDRWIRSGDDTTFMEYLMATRCWNYPPKPPPPKPPPLRAIRDV